MNWETLLCLGDSITFGARSYLGYPEICGDILEKKLEKKWNVINHATNGFTTIDLVRSLNHRLVSYKEVFPSIITIMIGTNDIKNNTDPNDFAIAYNQLLLKASLFSVNKNIVILKIPRFTKKVFYPYNFGMNQKVETFNRIIDVRAKEYSLRTLELVLEDDDFFDGVHLSPVGVRNAAIQLASYILEDKGFENIIDLPKNAISSN